MKIPFPINISTPYLVFYSNDETVIVVPVARWVADKWGNWVVRAKW